MQNLFEYLINKVTKEKNIVFNNIDDFLNYIKEIGGGYEPAKWADEEEWGEIENAKRFKIFIGPKPRNKHLAILIAVFPNKKHFVFTSGNWHEDTFIGSKNNTEYNSEDEAEEFNYCCVLPEDSNIEIKFDVYSFEKAGQGFKFSTNNAKLLLYTIRELEENNRIK